MVRLVAMCCHEWEPVPRPRAPGTVLSEYQPFQILHRAGLYFQLFTPSNPCTLTLSQVVVWAGGV